MGHRDDRAGARTGTATPRPRSSGRSTPAQPSFPPVGSNFSQYNNPAVNALIAKAASQASTAAAGKLWAKIDQMVTMEAPTFQITQDLQPNFHSSFVHNAVYVPAIQNFDPTNVWLSTPGS